MNKYKIVSQNKLVVAKGNYTVDLICPDMSSDGKNIVPCTLRCPRCYEVPIYSTRFGPPSKDPDGDRIGTKLVTCGQHFINKEDG